MLSNLLRGLKNPPDFASRRFFRWRLLWLRQSLPPSPKSSRLQEEEMFDYFRVPDMTSIHSTKLLAWALYMGESSHVVLSPDRSVRPHRGMLPDIDTAMAVPDSRRRSVFRRLADLVRGFAGPVEALEIAPAASLSGAAKSLSARRLRWITLGSRKPNPVAEPRRPVRPTTTIPAPLDAARVPVAVNEN